MENRKSFEAHHNDRPLREILSEFRTARADLVTQFEGADQADWVRSALHPRLKTPMRLLDLAFFVAEHDDHHLATISELLRST
ncbi:MAG TPA: DinB family protein [Gemmatimonadales bacterium]